MLVVVEKMYVITILLLVVHLEHHTVFMDNTCTVDLEDER